MEGKAEDKSAVAKAVDVGNDDVGVEMDDDAGAVGVGEGGVRDEGGGIGKSKS